MLPVPHSVSIEETGCDKSRNNQKEDIYLCSASPAVIRARQVTTKPYQGYSFRYVTRVHKIEELHHHIACLYTRPGVQDVNEWKELFNVKYTQAHTQVRVGGRGAAPPTGATVAPSSYYQIVTST